MGSFVLNWPNNFSVAFDVVATDNRSSNFQAAVQQNGVILPLPPTPNSSYSGYTEGLIGQKANLSLSPTGLWANFVVNGQGYEIIPVSHLIEATDRVFALVASSAVIPVPSLGCLTSDGGGISSFTSPPTACPIVSLPDACPGYSPGDRCGVVCSAQDSGSPHCSISPNSNTLANGELEILIAIEADYEYFLSHGGNSSDVMNAILSTIDQANDQIFRPYFFTSLAISNILIHSTPDNPYSDTGDILQLWNELQTSFNARPDRACLRFDVVQLFTGKSVGGSGVVNTSGVGAICEAQYINPPFQVNSTNAFGVSRHLNTIQNYKTMAHEIFHNFGLSSAFHTDVYYNDPNNDGNCFGICNRHNDLDFIFCSVEGGYGYPAFLGDEQCRIYKRILDAACCLTINQPLPQPGDQCNIESTIQLSNTSIVPGCDADNEVTYEVTVCNDFTSDRSMKISLAFPTNSQEITAQDFNIFPNPPINFNSTTRRLVSEFVPFLANECKTTSIKARIADNISVNPSMTLYLSTASNSISSAVAAINVLSTTIGNSTLSDLIQNSSLFPESTVACAGNIARNLRLSGTLVVNVPEYCLNNYNFSMSAGAAIVIKSGNTLTINDSEFFSCNNLWESITLEPGATLIANGCRFEQARYAIAAQANTTVHLSNCTFKDNYIGIKYEGDASSGDLLVRGSRFYHENGLNETVLGTTRPYAGMDIRGISIAQVQGLADASGTIGNTTFTGLHNGILSGASQLDVADATFVDLNHSYEGRGQTGYGIYQRGSRGVVAGLSVDNGANTAPSAIFNDCRIGIYANQSNLWVSGVQMRDVQTGIETVNCRARQLRVFSSDIEAKLTGVSLVQNQPAVVIVENNLIRINDPSNISFTGTGILSAENTGYSDYNLHRIRNNTIHIDSGREGIRLTGGRFQYLYNNYIYLNTANAGRKGVQIAGSFRPFLSFNQIFGPSATNYNSTFGIWADGLADPTLECNTTTHLDKGMQFWGLNDNTDLRGNTFHAGGTGLQIGVQNTNGTINNAAIDEQIQRGNSWDGMFGSGYGAFHASDLSFWWDQSFFEVDVNENPLYLPNNNIAGNDWITHVENQEMNTFTCPNSPLPPSNDGRYLKPSALEEKILEGDFIIPGYENTSTAIAQSRLLNRWTSPATTDLGSAKFGQFISSTNGTRIGDLETDRAALNNALSITSEDITTISETTERIEGIALELQHSDENNRYTLLTEMTQAQGSLNNLLSNLDYQRVQALNQLTLGTISPIYGGGILNGGGFFPQTETTFSNREEPFIKAAYEVQELLIKSDAESLSATDSLALLAIAESCPWLNGDAVYEARALFAFFNADRTFDGDYCSLGIAPLQQAATELPPLSILLFPNPAKAYILVKSNRPLERSRVCQLYDISGKIIIVEYLGGEENTIYLDINSLQPGVYFIEAIAADGSRATRKFVKQ